MPTILIAALEEKSMSTGLSVSQLVRSILAQSLNISLPSR
jgi:hypothetical protein